jgi:teichuronic acid biosynthesis glycosyltransferase TuaC
LLTAAEKDCETIATAGPYRLKVLVFSSLFPNSIQPLAGNFVMERMRHLLPYADMSVVAPVPYFPRWNLNRKWYAFARIPSAETHRGFHLEHPRYLVVPKIGMAVHGLSMFLGCLHTVIRRSSQTRYDVIDAHYVYPDGFAALLLGQWLGVPVVVSARGSDINVFPRFRTIRPLIRRVLTRAAALIAVSDGLKDVMVQLGCPPEKITVISNGVDSLKFYPRPQSECREFLRLPPAAPILLAVGHLNENKGFHILIEAIKQLQDRRPDILLVIVGDGPWKMRLQRIVCRMGLESNVRLAGARPHEELSRWYSAADVFCLASRTEGSPNVVMEALACGRPVLATAAASAVLTNPSSGIIVERSVQDFSRGMEQALSRDWDYSAIAAHASSQGWDSVAQRVLKVLADAAAKRN